MTKFQNYFYTDWSAMTITDWFGLTLTVVIFVLMVIVYFWVFNPKNRESFESHRTMLMNDDDKNAEKENGRE